MSDDPPKFPKRYSAPGSYSAPRLWRKLKRVAFKASRQSLKAALVLFHCLRDADTPKWAKGVIAGALGYLILPMDLVPDILPGIGYSDDWSAILAALATVAAYIKDEHKRRAEDQLRRLFGDGPDETPTEFIE